ncbi:MAG: hypothetical protein J0I13_03625 [Rhizobiales bacterium]|jgi:hypothetical protein|nr:hypothetical protein [Hyphomicrobiales bacterium]
MFRLDFGDGSISDMLNLSRAIDAAHAIALAKLNHYEGQECPSKGGLIAQNKKGAGLPLADQIQRASEEATDSHSL